MLEWPRVSIPSIARQGAHELRKHAETTMSRQGKPPAVFEMSLMGFMNCRDRRKAPPARLLRFDATFCVVQWFMCCPISIERRTGKPTKKSGKQADLGKRVVAKGNSSAIIVPSPKGDGTKPSPFHVNLKSSCSQQGLFCCPGFFGLLPEVAHHLVLSM